MFNLFLENLKAYISDEEYSSILLPNKTIISQANRNKFLKRPNILRLDGCDNFKGNFSTLLHILFRQKYVFDLPEFLLFLDNKEIIPSKILSKYFSRYILKANLISDAIIFQTNISKKMYEDILDFDTSKKKYFVINNGTIFNKYQILKRDNLIFGYPACFVSASNYRTIKRLDETISLCNLLRIDFPDIKLHIIGNTNLIKRFNKKIFNYGFIKE